MNPQRYAILGDIHSNWPALAAVLADAREQSVTAFVSVGDIVGYNAQPRECLDTIMEMDCVAVMGNHDYYCCCDEAFDDFHPLAAEVLRWTRAQLSEKHMAFLRGLQHVRRVAGFTLVHSTLDMPEKWGYVFDSLEAEANFNYQSTPVCFYGHTHLPVAFRRQRSVAREHFSQVRVELGTRYFVNVGSVGQPRDGDPRSAYVIYDTGARTIEVRRVPYPIEAAQEAILAAKLPERLARRLQFGK